MNTLDPRRVGVLLLAVVALTSFHCYLDHDHLRFDHRPVGTILSVDRSVEHDICLCFSHGLFLPVFSASEAVFLCLERPLSVPSENPLTVSGREIFHPPLG